MVLLLYGKVEHKRYIRQERYLRLELSYHLDSLAVLIEAIRIRLISKQSFSIDEAIL